MYGRLRKSWSQRTGPTIRTTSGVCVPGASCVAFDRAGCCEALVPLVCANAPEPTSATKTPKRQRTEAIKTRRLKKADSEADFFFIAPQVVRANPVVRGFPCEKRVRWLCWSRLTDLARHTELQVRRQVSSQKYSEFFCSGVHLAQLGNGARLWPGKLRIQISLVRKHTRPSA